MADLKKQLIEQVDGLLRKGEIKGTEYRTLVTKIELADPRFLKMALDKFDVIRKSLKKDEEEEEVKKAGAAAPAATPAPTPSAPAAAAKPSAPAGGIASAVGGAARAVGSTLASTDIAGVGSARASDAQAPGVGG